MHLMRRVSHVAYQCVVLRMSHISVAYQCRISVCRVAYLTKAGQMYTHVYVLRVANAPDPRSESCPRSQSRRIWCHEPVIHICIHVAWTRRVPDARTESCPMSVRRIANQSRIST